jgi:DNA-binding XRE family transcriptional regulator
LTALLRAVRRLRGPTSASVDETDRPESTPSIAVALKVARALEVNVAQLFSDQSGDEKVAVEAEVLVVWVGTGNDR